VILGGRFCFGKRNVRKEEITSREGAGRLFWLRTSLSGQRAKPDLAIWAHQAGQMSGQALEVTVEAKKSSVL